MYDMIFTPAFIALAAGSVVSIFSVDLVLQLAN